MTLISYAQNHEDILLWRALKNIENGFYIDVGASDPFEDSVTQLFYERNWRGINIEPSLKSYQRLCQERTLDINLCCAVGDCQGKTTFYDIPTRGWSTSDSKVGEFYRQKGENVTLREVEILCLNSILESHQKPSIHFLKIDVEGSEKSVLKGLNLSVFRPWVLLVEAISPIDQTASYEEWEPQVLNSGYRFVYFDGLNRFYIAEEHYEELKQAFAYPPNVLDDFVSSSVIHWQTQAQQWQTQAQQAQARSQQLETELGAVLASRSWRLTSPLRKIGLIVRKLVAVRRKLCTSYRTPQSQVRLVRRKLNELVHKLRNRYRILQRQNDINDFVTNDLLQNFDIDAFALPLGAGQRNIYLFVDHTITCSTNTGVQRVTRALAAALVHCHERVRYIKWDSNKKKAVLINLDEREYLAHWNGPKVTEEDREIYSALNSQQVSIEPHISGENHWLIVPEVTHITNHDRPVTLDLILWARQTHLKVGFIFYDAIPLQRPEFADMAPKHRAYMQQLLLADMVWPISTWSAQDLLAYWKFHESADINIIPEVTPLLLSGESHLCERVLTPLEGKSLILSVGTLEPRKNQVALIQAFNSYCQDRPQTPWKLVLVGNLHPAVAEFVNHAVRTNPSICYLGHVSDKQLDELYRTCSFTVFPSTNEGFGLPILESLWYAKPCLCANFGSMAEVAKEGGCLAVDTRNLNTLTQALTQLIEDKDLRNKLVSQALTRPIRSWNEYAGLITDRVEQAGNLTSNINTIYYWVESSLQFPKNTGIQRVSRQLARALMEKGFKLIPVQWDTQKNQLSPVSNEELAFFAKWNGPSVEMWQDWLPPNPEIKGCWFLMAELPLNRSATERQLLLNYVRSSGLSCAAIFHDAIPWVMRAIYPPHFAQAHREYMLELNEYDLVLPISCSSTNDLIDFLGGTLPKPQSFNSQIKTVLLPGEFVENDRQFQGHELGEKIVKILCVGTVEPRKNHETLLKAFILAKQRSKVSLELVIVGGSHSIEPELADRVRDFILKHPNITWEENANDAQLQEFLKACDFTVYPSIKEGFGLPILESLWSAKPCICANFGSMKEVAEGGGCLMVDVTNVEALAEAIQQLANNPQLHQTLTQEAIARPFKSWHDYALEVAFRLAEKVNSPKVQSSPAPLLVDSPATQLDVDKTRVEVMNLSPRPLLSVCISTYNRAEWLATSLKNWTNLYPHVLPEIEFLVCDNTSTDHTPEVVKPYISRPDFSYYRNEHNVGMLGNLRQTAHYARGQYIWILGDDDLLMPGSIETILRTLKTHPRVALVYLNYAFTRIEDARTIKDFTTFFKEATPIVPAEADRFGSIQTICARNENFFTAIYTLVFRRDHAIRAYSQETSGRPFSTMLTCIPTTHYVLNHMMALPGVWIGTPQIVVNMNVSWMKYAPLWILERIPEVYEEAERRGANSEEIDRWRRHTLPGVMNYFREIFENDPLNNGEYFSPSRLVRRFKHLTEFQKLKPKFLEIYTQAHERGHPAAKAPVSKVFPESISQ